MYYHFKLIALIFLCWHPVVLFSQEDVGDPAVAEPSQEAILDNLLGNARATVAKGNYAAAVVQFRQAAEIAVDAGSKTQATIQYELGNAYRRLNQHEQALAAYKLGLSILATAQIQIRSKILNAQGISYRRLGKCDYRHPYYWASFILLGNWL